MRRTDIRPGMKLVYGGGPVRGGWFTECGHVLVVRLGAVRILVKHLDGVKAGTTSWVTAPFLTIPRT